ncbi:MAG: response regulator transcription factor [Propionibacteriaceae bacterium]|jgi:two-component system response regulator RegX3|nr:response regulator transcription factor [Propionibacteriaceae bacterium]
MTRLLLVEDADDLRETLAYLLHREGYEVVAVADGRAALDQVERSQPDVIVLDLMIPEVSGIEVCRRVRLTSDVPIIMVTAMVGEANVIMGLESGADDYITKPFSIPELLARLRSLLRRRPTSSDDEQSWRVAGVVMDLKRHRVHVDGRAVDMPLREYDLLELLLRNAGRVLTRRHIIDQVWGADYFGDTKTLDVHIRRLRAKIERDPAHPSRLVTVRGLGYRFDDDGGSEA